MCNLFRPLEATQMMSYTPPIAQLPPSSNYPAAAAPSAQMLTDTPTTTPMSATHDAYASTVQGSYVPPGVPLTASEYPGSALSAHMGGQTPIPTPIYANLDSGFSEHYSNRSLIIKSTLLPTYTRTRKMVTDTGKQNKQKRPNSDPFLPLFSINK